MVISVFLNPVEQLGQTLSDFIFFFGSSTAVLNHMIYGAISSVKKEVIFKLPQQFRIGAISIDAYAKKKSDALMRDLSIHLNLQIPGDMNGVLKRNSSKCNLCFSLRHLLSLMNPKYDSNYC
ncbi:hypothetical protein TNCT_304291 [Trichonephila clavata]|uniref:Uncharacterized protein n=1 Tax=Trichonephila clavata TaxID=2740835 RepID=A0A8X6HU44_TRICU|nr:hypothetical protein TNCT_304291 [Trichonephila clavata]